MMNGVRDQLDDLDRRTTTSAAEVLTGQSTTSTSFTDLTTVGPAVTVTIGSTGKAMSSLYAAFNNNTVGQESMMGLAVSGATTIAASDAYALGMYAFTASAGLRMSAIFLVTGLNAGSNTFTTKYRATGGTATFFNRRLLVTPLGS